MVRAFFMGCARALLEMLFGVGDAFTVSRLGSTRTELGMSSERRHPELVSGYIVQQAQS